MAGSDGAGRAGSGPRMQPGGPQMQGSSPARKEEVKQLFSIA